jgi:hypothetical protein
MTFGHFVNSIVFVLDIQNTIWLWVSKQQRDRLAKDVQTQLAWLFPLDG